MRQELIELIAAMQRLGFHPTQMRVRKSRIDELVAECQDRIGEPRRRVDPTQPVLFHGIELIPDYSV